MAKIWEALRLENETVLHRLVKDSLEMNEFKDFDMTALVILGDRKSHVAEETKTQAEPDTVRISEMRRDYFQQLEEQLG